MNKIAAFEQKFIPTPIIPCNKAYEGNTIWVKRDDLLPFSFGGNKVRKAQKFYHKIKQQQADCVVTYGSSSSNHCRIIANMAAAMGIRCHIISPVENYHETANTQMIRNLGATVEYCPVTGVKETIDHAMERLGKKGNPYFIMGGGHGNPGTEGYIGAYEEILAFEKEQGIHFDYIFHASGTGATQAGLVTGQLLAEVEDTQIVGISIARLEEPGGKVVLDSIIEYLEMLEHTGRLTTDRKEMLADKAKEELIFTDRFRLDGYGNFHQPIRETIQEVLTNEGFSMDTTYVGKAFWGMRQYLKEEQIKGKNILFLHTGGTPLFFKGVNL